MRKKPAIMPYHRFVQKRLEWVIWGFGLLYVSLFARLCYLQIYHHAFFVEKAVSVRHKKLKERAKSGPILDRNRQYLAMDFPAVQVNISPDRIGDDERQSVISSLAEILNLDRQYIIDKMNVRRGRVTLQRRLASAETLEELESSRLPGVRLVPEPDAQTDPMRWQVVVYPKAIPSESLPTVITALSDILNLDRETLEEKVTAPPDGIILKRHIKSEETKRRLKEAKLPGVSLLSDPMRLYSGEAPHVVGFTDVDRVGLAGLELRKKDILSGHEGQFEAEVDAQGRILPGTKREITPARNGSGLLLTIDADIQHDAQQFLLDAHERFQTVGGCVIVVDPFTGEILALANVPTFDPGNRKPGENRAWWNWAISNLYEPGSTLKVITAAAALDAGAISPHSVFYCPGRQKIGKHTVGCIIHRPFKGKHGAMSVEQIIQYSCNLGAAAIGRKAGYMKISDYFHRFGFDDDTGIDLPAEASGNIRSASQKWPEISLANISFGQGIHVTALQLAMAYAAIANGGTLMKPLLIKAITDTEGKTILQSFGPQPVRRVISAETARIMTGFMETVVEEGTGKTAKITGYTVAGKTGSAQKAVGKTGYVPGKFIASFAGFFPARKPRYVMIAVLDEPKGTHWGATVAAPVFKALGESIALMQAIPEDDPASRLKEERKQARLYGRAIPLSPQTGTPPAADVKQDRTGVKKNGSNSL